MQPKFSIIIPTYNEDKINEHLASLKNKLSGFSYEIIVSDGSPNHTTLAKIQDKSIIHVQSTAGRGNGLADGGRVARGEILWFVHSDTIVPDNALELINKAMFDSDAGAFELGISSPQLRYRVIEFGTNIRTKITKIPYGDQTLFIKKEVYNKINGYKRLPLMEDVDIMQRLKKEKIKLATLKQKAKTSPRRWEKEGAIYTTLRNQVIINLYYLGVSPEKLVSWYRANKK